ncbi:hypothetical protein [Mycolicibacterium porcinum]|uniref:hypothetical protein n=1 Tax=Mycolicibacterium porcinum TaxID=39693 RepID=UPI0013F4DF5F|nr:hypothetical protein [Mycolicibacterium porcinum]
MPNPLPEQLQQRCAQIDDENAQGIPLARFDYVLLALITLIIPAILIAIGALL